MEPIIGKYGDIVGYRLTSSGRVIDCREGFIAINSQSAVSDGVRSHYSFAPRDVRYGSPLDRWTVAERVEVADYVIALWQQFKTQTVEP